ncbi:MAG: hypothetical protein HY077_14420 [Elusimicrobia bacterium]|nr:hypothetical protein [Elusimicrobiota bacterium]
MKGISLSTTLLATSLSLSSIAMPANHGGSISGVLRKTDTHAPIRLTKVEIFRPVEAGLDKVAEQMTLLSGSYSFTGLAWDTYTVSVDQISGEWVAFPEHVTRNIVLSPERSNARADFDYSPTGSIEGNISWNNGTALKADTINNVSTGRFISVQDYESRAPNEVQAQNGHYRIEHMVANRPAQIIACVDQVIGHPLPLQENLMTNYLDPQPYVSICALKKDIPIEPWKTTKDVHFSLPNLVKEKPAIRVKLVFPEIIATEFLGKWPKFHADIILERKDPFFFERIWEPHSSLDQELYLYGVPPGRYRLNLGGNHRRFVYMHAPEEITITGKQSELITLRIATEEITTSLLVGKPLEHVLIQLKDYIRMRKEGKIEAPQL